MSEGKLGAGSAHIVDVLPNVLQIVFDYLVKALVYLVKTA